MNAAREKIEALLRNAVTVPPSAPSNEDQPADPLRYELASAMDQPTSGKYLVRGLVDAAVVLCIYGESGAGKSSMAIELALSIASGRPFLGRRVSPGAVLYLAGEGGRGLRNRIIAARMAGNVSADIPLAVVRAPVLLDSNDAVRVVAAAQALAAETGQPVQMIVFDTLARSLIGDENSTQDMGAAIRAFEEIREATGATVALVHHAGKDTSKGARGSSALRAALDTELLVEGRENPRVMSVTKQRDLPMTGPVAFTLESVQIGTDSENEPITAAVVREGEPVTASPQARGKQQTVLLAALEQRQEEAPGRLVWPLVELRKIARDLGMHKSTARDAVHGLLQHGVLVQTVGGSYLTTVEPKGRTGRNGTKQPDSSRAGGTDGTEVSIDTDRPSRPTSLAEVSHVQ